MRPLVLLALVGAALLLPACGGGEDGESAEAEIRTMIESFAMSSDPADCVRFSTRRWVMQATKESAGSLTEMCAQLAALEIEPPRQVTVSEVEVEGDEATAHVAFEGSSNDGQTIEVALLRDGEQWKLNEMLSFVVLDPEQLVLQQGREMMEMADSALEAQLTACLVDRLDRLDDAALEELLLSFSAQPMIDLILACEPPSAAV